MTWATVITLSFIGFFGITGALKESASAELAMKLLINGWLLACAISIWDRYL